MVVAALSSSPDAFSIVLLSTLGKRQSISATDMRWLPQGEMFHANSLEMTSVVHTASDDEPPGTVLTQADFSGGALSLDSSDQLLIYQGAESNPTFLCAFDWSGYDWKTTDSSVSSSYSGSSYSGLPRGLTSGVDALNTKTLGWSYSYYNNWAYKGTDSAHIDGLRTAIATGSNWQYSNAAGWTSVASHVKTSFTVLPPPPAPPGPLTCGPGTEENSESSQCEISCAAGRRAEEEGAFEPSPGKHVRQLMDAYVARHPGAAAMSPEVFALMESGLSAIMESSLSAISSLSAHPEAAMMMESMSAELFLQPAPA